MVSRVDEVIKNVLTRVKPSAEELEEIEKELAKFERSLKKEIKKQKLEVEVFVGGSFAKKTLVKKDKYDIDVFLRFDESYPDKDLSKLAEKLLKDFEGLTVMKGSRNYFQIKVGKELFFEIVPVKSVSNPESSENITDLSYSHVSYVNKKSKGLVDQIVAAKAFCHAKNCYGAESYIKGFSGYALELLLIHYGSFEKFIKEMVKVKEKLVIDIEKQHKNKADILIDLNESKLQSPIILIDPTYKYRNALAALSDKTFEKFQAACKKFLEHPREEEFEQEKTNIQKIRESSIKKGEDFLVVEAKTDKPAGDIAGSKLLKFSNYFFEEISKLFIIKQKGFEYNGEQAGQFFVSAKKKTELIYEGPKMTDKKNVALFKKKHKRLSMRDGRIYAREEISGNLAVFFKNWARENKKIVKEMYIVSLRIV